MRQTDSVWLLCSVVRRHSCRAVLHHCGASARRPERGQHLGPVLSKAIAELDSNLPTYFAGTPARLHDEILGVNRLTA